MVAFPSLFVATPGHAPQPRSKHSLQFCCFDNKTYMLTPQYFWLQDDTWAEVLPAEKSLPKIIRPTRPLSITRSRKEAACRRWFFDTSFPRHKAEVIHVIAIRVTLPEQGIYVLLATQLKIPQVRKGRGYLSLRWWKTSRYRKTCLFGSQEDYLLPLTRGWRKRDDPGR